LNSFFRLVFRIFEAKIPVVLCVNGNDFGTSELLSVPYALYAKSVENDNAGNDIFSISSVDSVNQSDVNMDTIAVKANRLVKIEGYKRTNGVSSITVDFMMLDGGVAINDIWLILTTSSGVNSHRHSQDTGYSSDEIHFTGYYMPAADISIVVRTKELSATSTGTGEAVVVITQ
jgi:hypothetical protein